jgi:hypothetical protein
VAETVAFEIDPHPNDALGSAAQQGEDPPGDYHPDRASNYERRQAVKELRDTRTDDQDEAEPTANEPEHVLPLGLAPSSTILSDGLIIHVRL